jgi:hypothetical protein
MHAQITDILEYVVSFLVSGSLLLGGAAFLFQASFTRLLDKRMEVFKQQLQLDTKVRELVLKSQIDFRERQLGEFYGPIYAMLKRGKPIYDLWTAGRLDEIDASLSEMFRSQNDAVVKILLEKAHLMDGDKIPESFTRFLTHVAVWHGYVETEHRGVPHSEGEFPEVYYPESFEEEIFSTTERLKKELYELHNHYGLLLKTDA